MAGQIRHPSRPQQAASPDPWISHRCCSPNCIASCRSHARSKLQLDTASGSDCIPATRQRGRHAGTARRQPLPAGQAATSTPRISPVGIRCCAPGRNPRSPRPLTDCGSQRPLHSGRPAPERHGTHLHPHGASGVLAAAGCAPRGLAAAGHCGCAPWRAPPGLATQLGSSSSCCLWMRRGSTSR